MNPLPMFVLTDILRIEFGAYISIQHLLIACKLLSNDNDNCFLFLLLLSKVVIDIITVKEPRRVVARVYYVHHTQHSLVIVVVTGTQSA